MYEVDVAILKWANSWVFWKPWADALIIFRVEWLPWWFIAGLLVFGVLTVPPIAVIFPSFRPFRRKNWEMIFVAFAGALIARFGIVELIRLFYNRPRPFDLPAEALAKAGVHLRQLILHESGHSFPSGHAAFFFAIAAVVGRYYPKTSVLFWAAALSLSFSRVVVGLHWPSDIVAGAAIGIAVGLFVHHIFSKFLMGKKKTAAA